MTQPDITVESFTDDQLAWLTQQPGPVKRLAQQEQERRASRSAPETSAGTTAAS